MPRAERPPARRRGAAGPAAPPANLPLTPPPQKKTNPDQPGRVHTHPQALRAIFCISHREYQFASGLRFRVPFGGRTVR